MDNIKTLPDPDFASNKPLVDYIRRVLDNARKEKIIYFDLTYRVEGDPEDKGVLIIDGE